MQLVVCFDKGSDKLHPTPVPRKIVRGYSLDEVWVDKEKTLQMLEAAGVVRPQDSERSIRWAPAEFGQGVKVRELILTLPGGDLHFFVFEVEEHEVSTEC